MLYALAAEKVLLAEKNARPLGVAYWLVGHDGAKHALPAGGDATAWLENETDWAKVRDQLQRWVAEVVGHIRQGTFALKPRSTTCTETCPYAQVCRIAQARRVEKSWELALPLASSEF
jgi:hypothetical protein